MEDIVLSLLGLKWLAHYEDCGAMLGRAKMSNDSYFKWSLPHLVTLWRLVKKSSLHHRHINKRLTPNLTSQAWKDLHHSAVNENILKNT